MPGSSRFYINVSLICWSWYSRQCIVDYAKTRALSYRTRGLPGAISIYDINCQYCKKFWACIKAHPEELGLPENINEATLIFVVGSFHLSAHVAECFSEFSLHFVKGVGNIAGKILETLWNPFNNISPMCRPMTGSQRSEIYDDHMRDSNWKKLVNMSNWIFYMTKYSSNISW